MVVYPLAGIELYSVLTGRNSLALIQGRGHFPICQRLSAFEQICVTILEVPWSKHKVVKNSRTVVYASGSFRGFVCECSKHAIFMLYKNESPLFSDTKTTCLFMWMPYRHLVALVFKSRLTPCPYVMKRGEWNTK